MTLWGCAKFKNLNFAVPEHWLAALTSEISLTAIAILAVSDSALKIKTSGQCSDADYYRIKCILPIWGIPFLDK